MNEEPRIIELPSQDELLMAVGKGIQQFAVVEAAVQFMFADLMEPADRHSSILVMSAVWSLEAKLRIVGGVLDHRLDGEVATRGRALLRRVESLKEKRNKLAHWTVTHWPGVSSFKEAQDMEVVLAPPVSSKDWGNAMWGGGQWATKVIRAADIKSFCDDCTALLVDFVAFKADGFPGQDGAQ